MKILAIASLLFAGTVSAWEWDSEPRTVKAVQFAPNSSSYKMLYFEINENGNVYEYNAGAPGHSMEDMKILLSLLLTAQSTGKKVRAFQEAYGGNFRFEKLSLID